jgi:hypothetical protein
MEAFLPRVRTLQRAWPRVNIAGSRLATGAGSRSVVVLVGRASTTSRNNVNDCKLGLEMILTGEEDSKKLNNDLDLHIVCLFQPGSCVFMDGFPGQKTRGVQMQT